MADEYWAESQGSVVDAPNFVAKAGKKISPTEMMTGKRPFIDHLRVIGTLSWTRVQDQVRKKLDAKARKGIVAYPMGSIDFIS